MEDPRLIQRQHRATRSYKFFVIFSIISTFATAFIIYFYDSLDTRSSANTENDPESESPNIPLNEAPLSNPPGADLDERFAFSGSGEIADGIGAVWGYNWGHGSDHPNEHEVRYHNDYGDKVFFTVGKLDAGGSYEEIADDPDIYLADQTEVDAYNEVVGLIDEISQNVLTDPDTRQRIKATYLYIPELAELDITHYWVVANEPDWVPFVPADWYAHWYKLFSERIRKYDPLAKVSFGGLFRVKYPFDELEADPDWRHEWLMGDGYVDALIDAAPDEDAKDRIRRNAWFHYFREFYIDEYGSYPQIDFVNIHAYTLEVKEPVIGPPLETLVDIAQGHVDTMLDYMDHNGMGDLPVWVTEFGYLNELCGPVYDPDTGIPETNEIYFTECNALWNDTGLQGGFLEEMVEYYITDRRVQRFFTFKFGSSYKHPWTYYRGWTSDIIFSDITGELNDQGLLYISLAEEFDDSEPPVIATPSFETGEINITVTTSVTDAGSNSSGPVEYWYSVSESALTSIDTPADLLDWNFVLTTSGSFETTLPLDLEGNVFNLVVRDSAGNESYKNAVIPVIDPIQPPPPDPDPILVDINGDGEVNIADYALFVGDYMEFRNNGVLNERSDLNDDSRINIGDYSIFVQGYLANR